MTQKAAARWIAFTSIGLFCFAVLGIRSVRAADLDYAADYLNRQQANMSSGISHTLFFTPVTTLPVAGNSVRLEFPKSPVGTWCRTAGADLSASGVSDPQAATESATPLPGALTAGCTIGNGVTTFDTITISNIGSLNAGTKYGVSMTETGTAQLGTPPAANSIWQMLYTNNGVTDIDSLLFYANTLPSDQVSVTATVVATPPVNPNPTIEFHGYATTNGTVSVVRDGTTISTVPTGSDGLFNIILQDQTAGQHVYTVSGQDINHLDLTPITFALQLNASSTTVINDVFLGPTMTLSTTSVVQDASVTAAGYTAPNSSVSVVVTSSTQTLTYTAAANAQGFWSKTIAASGLNVTSYSIKARASLGGALVSEYSQTLNFSVAAVPSQPGVPNPPPEVPGGPKCIGKDFGDTNCDGRVDLADFSVLLFYWQSTNPKNSRVDLNHDGKVDVVDFSILMYLWTV
jgi:hypothetical protein